MLSLSRDIALAMLAMAAIMLYALAAQAAEPKKQQGIFHVTMDDAEKAAKMALEHVGAADLVEASVTSQHTPVLYRHKRPLKIMMKTLRHDEEKNQWSANLIIMDGEEVLTAMPLSGRYAELAMVPMATRRLANGDLIAEEDLEERPYPLAKIRKKTILRVEDLLGKTPQRIISKGRPIRTSELQEPDIIDKGTTVKMQFNTPYITITAVGEALEPGAKGEYIRVRNQDSDTVVRARIENESQVQVGNQAFQMGQLSR